MLIIDEIGYTRLSHDQAHALFDLVAARYERRSLILTSNLTFTEWGGLLGDEVLATALLDRLPHHAEVLTINGRSYRMRERMEVVSAGSLGAMGRWAERDRLRLGSGRQGWGAATLDSHSYPLLC
ncbi:MAG: ATP-binding protein [Kouleothrix sp.]|nr:ATP-binding protein [Kouleothrix sp.]